ncbi:MAG: lantibiotic immunity ABC transporter MutE/EpiE family permease subunit [Clostridium sp.]|jgi:ABC-2 type transport system permease protein|uniref:lantibiotic immunity ABC transporter MutE/EpiE family permease subunit n=1 Tax=Clostridium sp. TaxID=1506 RepID=UPI0025C3A6A5|nr:lantibiotic immunity ABC transporter MutE/EpiE family permease subunit [Clostridium sp.]MCH3963384.1 lantibiotic immunity ABC transporter MutE/EpiE family permease subunit [Clostridium sp.]MCI1716748.1 lantibiotic immunity ABC transporter MutE/EpiE family permease subunit [Clostridium sp.]MCI1801068.1 lantibiotic immunity ABC transporter MutE/EpiE family permease subunit [Clostridium sp.]MCI1814934.1 lantibiotic immunity ABC transporter MutE/EpiE family permease subunit [Clostridium sp.]MCI
MAAYFKSESLKIKHGFSKKLVFLAPVFTIIVSLFLSAAYFHETVYNWWYVMILPGMMSILCTLVAKQDGRMKNMAVIPLSVDLKKVWMSKIFLCMIIMAEASAVVLAGAVVIGNLLGIGVFKLPLLNQFEGISVLALTFLWQIPLCLFLGSKIGMFPTIIINMAAYMVLGILCAVKGFLWMIPYAIPARLMCPILKILPNGLPTVPGNQTFRPELLSKGVILPGIAISLVLFLVLAFATSKWYERQEAK